MSHGLVIPAVLGGALPYPDAGPAQAVRLGQLVRPYSGLSLPRGEALADLEYKVGDGGSYVSFGPVSANLPWQEVEWLARTHRFTLSAWYAGGSEKHYLRFTYDDGAYVAEDYTLIQSAIVWPSARRGVGMTFVSGVAARIFAPARVAEQDSQLNSLSFDIFQGAVEVEPKTGIPATAGGILEAQKLFSYRFSAPGAYRCGLYAEDSASTEVRSEIEVLIA